MTRKSQTTTKPAARKPAPARRGDPHKRLLATGLRLAALRTPQAVYGLLVAEAARFCGAQRTLLILEADDAPQIAGA